MPERLRILLVDGLILLVICCSALLVYRVVDMTRTVGTTQPAPVTLSAGTLGHALRDGEAIATARVLVEPSATPIFPGDEVILAQARPSPQVVGPLRVAAIEPPLLDDDDRVLVSFSGSHEALRSLRALRGERLLSIRLYRAHIAGAVEGTGQLSGAQVITRRFSGTAGGRGVVAGTLAGG